MTTTAADLHTLWNNLRLKLDAAKPEDGDQLVAPLRALLEDVLRSGSDLSDPSERFERQWLANAVADEYTRLTGTHVPRVLATCTRPPNKPRATPADSWTRSAKVGWVVAGVCALIAAGLVVVFGLVLAALIARAFTTEKQASNDGGTLHSTQASLNTAEAKVADLNEQLKALNDNVAKQNDKHLATLSGEEQRTLAVERCLTIIRGCRLTPSGAYLTRNDGTVWVEPGANARVALAILVAHDKIPNLTDREADLHAVGRWIDWYAKSKNGDGAVAQMDGTPTDLKPKAAITHAGAGDFLLVCQRYSRLMIPLSKERQDWAAEVASSILARIDTKDQLPWKDARLPADEKQKYLITAVTDAAGLRAAGVFLKDTHPQVAAKSKAAADELVKALQAFCRGSGADGAFSAQPAPAPLLAESDKDFLKVNLYGLAWIDDGKSALRKRLTDRRGKEDWSGVDPPAPPELWLMAANTDADRDALKAECVRQALAFTRMSTYVVRPANVILALLEQDRWMGLK